MNKPDSADSTPRLSQEEEPHIQREVDSDKTGTIRRYLRLADNLLQSRDEDPSSNVA